MNVINNISINDIRDEYREFLINGISEGIRLLNEAKKILDDVPELDLGSCKLSHEISVTRSVGLDLLKQLDKTKTDDLRIYMLGGLFMYRTNKILNHVGNHAAAAISAGRDTNSDIDDLLKIKRKPERIVN